MHRAAWTTNASEWSRAGLSELGQAARCSFSFASPLLVRPNSTSISHDGRVSKSVRVIANTDFHTEKWTGYLVSAYASCPQLNSSSHRIAGHESIILDNFIDCSGATTNTSGWAKIVLDEGWNRDCSIGRVRSHTPSPGPTKRTKVGPPPTEKGDWSVCKMERTTVLDGAICVGVMPYMQVLEGGRCILTFDCIRSISLGSLENAIAWCSEHLENEKPEQKRKAFDYLLAGDYSRRPDTDIKFQTDLISALLYAWSSCVRRSPKCNRCAGYSS